MSEKSKIDWRKVKEVAIFGIACIPIVLLSVAFVTVALIIAAAINGAIVSVCWNTTITTMFDFSKVTMLQAFVLAYTIGSLRTDYYNRAKSEYEYLKSEKIIEKIKNPKVAKVVLVLIIIVFEILSILIAVGFTMYSWNNILPRLLNVELVQINFWQAFGFAYLFNLLFGFSKSDEKKSKEDKTSNGKDMLHKTTDNIVVEEATKAEDFIE